MSPRSEGLVVDGLVKRYGAVTAVDDVSFTVAPGQFVSLLGPSGCGKTTTLRCIAGFERPDRGRISVGGETVTDAATGAFTPPNRRNFGMVFQSYAIWPHMSVLPEIVSIWGLPWQKAGSEPARGGTGAGAGGALAAPEHVCMLHGPPVIRGDRMFGAWWGGGVAVIDCSDLRDMKLLGHVNWSPPFVGGTHTAWPIGDRPYLVVTDEARARQKFWDSQFMWIVDIRDETNPVPVSTFFPDRETYFNRPGRFGAHNILENIPADGLWKDLVFLTYFNAGLRAVDVSDPLRPKEVGHFVPALPGGQEGIQSNDIGADEFGRLYLIDRWGAGMHIVEYTG